MQIHDMLDSSGIQLEEADLSTIVEAIRLAIMKGYYLGTELQLEDIAQDEKKFFKLFLDGYNAEVDDEAESCARHYNVPWRVRMLTSAVNEPLAWKHVYRNIYHTGHAAYIGRDWRFLESVSPGLLANMDCPCEAPVMWVDSVDWKLWGKQGSDIQYLATECEIIGCPGAYDFEGFLETLSTDPSILGVQLLSPITQDVVAAVSKQLDSESLLKDDLSEIKAIPDDTERKTIFSRKPSKDRFKPAATKWASDWNEQRYTECIQELDAKGNK